MHEYTDFLIHMSSYFVGHPKMPERRIVIRLAGLTTGVCVCPLCGNRHLFVIFRKVVLWPGTNLEMFLGYLGGRGTP